MSGDKSPRHPSRMRNSASRLPCASEHVRALAPEKSRDLGAWQPTARRRIASPAVKNEIVARRGRGESRRRRSGPGASFGAAADVENDALSFGQFRRPACRVVAHGKMTVHASGSARTSGNAQPWSVRVDDESEVAHRMNQRFRAERLEADDQEGPPRRQSEAARAKRPRAFDQRPEANRLDLAESRRSADDHPPAEFARA